MALQNYKTANNAQGLLLTGIGASATALILQTGQGGLFPSTFPFQIEIKEVDTAVNNYRVLKREIATCTNRSGDTLTITRATEPCPSDYISVTQTSTAFAFSNPASTVITQSFTAFAYNDLRDEAARLETAKLNTAGGLRTGFGTDKHVRVNRTTGAEESKAVTTGTTPVSTDILRFEKSSGAYEDIPYSSLITALGTIGRYTQTFPIGETTSGSVPTAIAIVAGAIVYSNTLGSNIAGARVKSGITFTVPYATTLGIVKTGQVANSTSARIQLLDSTGTLITEQTPGIGIDTVTFPGTAISASTIYKLVMNDSAYFNTQNNELALGSYQAGFQFATGGTVNGTDGLTPQNIKEIQLGTRKCMKAVANTTAEYGVVAGFKTGTTVKGDSITIEFTDNSMLSGFTGLTTDTEYYLSNTAGVISSSVGTNAVRIGIAKSTTDIRLGTNRIKIASSANKVVSSSTVAVTTRFVVPVKGNIDLTYSASSGGGVQNCPMVVYSTIDGINTTSTILTTTTLANGGVEKYLLPSRENGMFIIDITAGFSAGTGSTSTLTISV